MQYTDNFYKSQRNLSLNSARVIVPMMIDLVKPQSVVDVGCGVGGWLAVFQEQGVKDIQGIDGAYVNRAMLAIPADRFMEYDLQQPLQLERRFDLVMSLEVAEHLPPETAKTFVESLVKLGKVVLFSAAVPYQAGVHHVNEQWQDYWAQLFQQHGYVPVDYVRGRVWQNPDVAWWYAQNVLIYVQQDYLEQHPALKHESEITKTRPLALLHPKMLTDMGITRLMMLLRLLPFTINRALQKRLKRV